MIWEAVRDGRYLTSERVRVYGAFLLVGYVIAIIILLARSNGVVDAFGRPLGTDFANVYAAGKLVLEGNAAGAYDWSTHYEVQKAVSGRADIPFYGWHYPPFFLVVAGLLALLPYLGAVAAFQALTLPLYLLTLRRIVPQMPSLELMLAALAFPAVFINVTHGHNGFLSAALIGGALLVLDRRPVVAGILIGLLAYKPQFGVLIPLALAVSGRWQVFLAAALTVVLSVAITYALFGKATWLAFNDSLELTRTIVLEAGQTGFHKIQSLFAALRLWGAPVGLAYAAQGALMLALAAVTALLWRGKTAYELKAAGLVLACFLATPYCLDYDLVVIAPAIAFLAAHGLRHGFQPYEITLLAAAWVAPLVTRAAAQHAALPLGLLACLALLVLVCRRAGLLDALASQRPSLPGAVPHV